MEVFTVLKIVDVNCVSILVDLDPMKEIDLSVLDSTMLAFQRNVVLQIKILTRKLDKVSFNMINLV